MKKTLLIIIIPIVIMVILYIALIGIKIGNFELPSIMQLAEKSKEIDKKISITNALLSTYYDGKDGQLKEESKKMIEAKEEFLKLAENTSESEILEAMTEKTYQIDFLYTELGTHATDAGVYTEFTEVQGDYEGITDIDFTVEGSYIGITNFIYAIENDSKLNYRVKDFNLVPKDEKGSVLKATFTVKNVKIVY